MKKNSEYNLEFDGTILRLALVAFIKYDNELQSVTFIYIPMASTASRNIEL